MLLSTAIVDLISEQGKTKQCLLLLDNGSQYHYFLADPTFDKISDIEGIIGVGLFFKLLCIGQIEFKNHPAILQKTQLDWIAAGEVYGTSMSSQKTVQCNFACDSSMNFELSKFWELEEIPNARIVSPDEVACEELFAKTTLRNPDGRYLVRLPFNEKRDEIGYSRNLALRCLYSLESRFKRQPTLRPSYASFLVE